MKRKYGESEGCRVMAEECGQEIKRLEEERALLIERLAAIDKDIHQVWKSLSWEPHVAVIAQSVFVVAKFV